MTISPHDKTGINGMWWRCAGSGTAAGAFEQARSAWTYNAPEKADTHSHSDVGSTLRGIVETVSRPDDSPVLFPGEHPLRTSLDTGGTIPYPSQHLNGNGGPGIARNLLVKTSLYFKNNVSFLLTGSAIPKKRLRTGIIRSLFQGRHNKNSIDPHEMHGSWFQSEYDAVEYCTGSTVEPVASVA
jgi:hypothetical protein